MIKVDRNNVEDILPLAPTQAGILYHCLRAPDAAGYVVQVAIRLRGSVNREIFAAAWNAVVAGNEMLRATFRWRHTSDPIQIVLRAHAPRITCLDLTGLNPHEANLHLEELKTDDRRAVSDLEQVPFRIALLRLEAGVFEAVITYHHLVCDGWSIAVLLAEFVSAYTRLCRGEKPHFARKAQMKDFLQWRLRQKTEAEREYWTRSLNGVSSFSLILGPAPDGGTGNQLRHYSQEIPGSLIEAVQQFGRDYRAPLSAILYSVWAMLLARSSNCDDVVFGTSVSGRPAEIAGIENTVGCFVSTPPLRVRLRPTAVFTELVACVQQSVAERQRFEGTPAVDIRRYAGAAAGQEIFNNIFAIENYPVVEPGQDNTLAVESYTFSENPHYDLTVLCQILPKPTLNFVYRNDRFTANAVEDLGRHFVNLLSESVWRATTPLRGLEMLSATEARQLRTFNQTDVPIPEDQTVVDVFEQAAAGFPDRVAVIYGDLRLSYCELQVRADSFAACLEARGVRLGSIVGVMVERCLELLPVILGVLKAGAAYLPLARSHPAARLQSVLDESGAELVVVTGALPPGVIHDKVIDLDGVDRTLAETSATRRVPPSSAAYIMYTSGSTGRPKGVVVSHRAVVNLLGWLQRRFEFSAGDVILQSTPTTFDVSVWELFGGMEGGATLCLLPPAAEKDPAAIVRAVERDHVSAIHFVPSMLPAFLEYVETRDEALALSSLRLLFSSGEALRGTVANRVWKVMGNNPRLRFFNLYGPTETTVWVSSYECSRGMAGPAIVPLGKPLDNTRFHVLGHWGQPQPMGAWGELYITGACLADGYLHCPELTSERFGVRGYRTGDIVRWDSEGNLQFQGRCDRQVKIRGHRVELGEIESHLLTMPGIESVALIARDCGEDEPVLWAFYTARDPFDPAALRSWLARRLPVHMIPSRFVHRASLPLTASGKLDPSVLRETIEPENRELPVKEDRFTCEMAAIWGEVLALPPDTIRGTSNFFELGGSSITAVRLVSALFRRMNVNLPLTAVFEHPTPQGLAYVVRETRRSEFRHIPKAETREYYELSYSQRRVWMAQQTRPDSAFYNLVGQLEFRHAVDREAVHGALQALMRRHDSLRTRFVVVRGTPVQIVDSVSEPCLAFEDLSSLTESQQQHVKQQRLGHESTHPIDLSRPPLLHARLFKFAEDRYELLISLPHIVADGWSLELLKAEFESQYRGEGQLPPCPIQYKDYVAWERRLLADEQPTRGAREFWSSVLKGALALQLPYDFPELRGKPVCSAYRVVVQTKLTDRLRHWTRHRGIGLFMPLVAALQLTLAHLTGQRDILIGFPAAARQHESLRSVVGMFVNTLVLRTRIDPAVSLRQFCDTLQTEFLHALEFQILPLELICEELHIRFPQLAVLFNLLNVGRESDVPVSEFRPLHLPEVRESKFPLHFHVTEYANGIEIVCNYSSAGFRPATIERTMEIYVSFLERVTGAPHQKLGLLFPAAGAKQIMRPPALPPDGELALASSGRTAAKAGYGQ